MSSDPVDRMVRDLVRSPRSVAGHEVDQIVERIAGAPFLSAPRRTPVEFVGVEYEGRTVEAREDSAFVHMLRHVSIDRQWVTGTSVDGYLADLRSAVRAPSTRLALYTARGGTIVALVARTVAVLPEERRGAGWLPLLIVLFSADRGTIISGYQAGSLTDVRIPGDAHWLR